MNKELKDRWSAVMINLDNIITDYEEYWSFGTSPDPILQEMLYMSAELKRNASIMLARVEQRMEAWKQNKTFAELDVKQP